MKTKKLLKNFLVEVEITNVGPHYHRSYCLIAEPTEERAWNWVYSYALEKRFGFGDGFVKVKPNSIQKVTDKEAKLLERLGVAYFV